MYNAFISVIIILFEDDDAEDLTRFISNSHAYLSKTFSDFEIIIIDNCSGIDTDTLVLSEEKRQYCYTLKLSQKKVYDTAVLAGLDRANGDYTVVFDVILSEYIEKISDMYEAAQTGVDFVTLQQKRKVPNSVPFARPLFYSIMRGLSPLQLDNSLRNEILISRRALNWILRFRLRDCFLKEIYLTSGFLSKTISVNFSIDKQRRTRKEQFSLGWSSLMRVSSLPARIAESGIILSSILLLIMMINAILVKIFGMDIFGIEQSIIPGWTYLVFIIALGFLVTNVTLYVLLRAINVLIENSRSEPLYIVERFNRL